MTVEAAHERVVKAQARLAEARAEVEHANNTLTEALAARGWRRFGAIADVRLYEKLGGSPIAETEVVAYELDAERRAAA